MTTFESVSCSKWVSGYMGIWEIILMITQEMYLKYFHVELNIKSTICGFDELGTNLNYEKIVINLPIFSLRIVIFFTRIGKGFDQKTDSPSVFYQNGVWSVICVNV